MLWLHFLLQVVLRSQEPIPMPVWSKVVSMVTVQESYVNDGTAIRMVERAAGFIPTSREQVTLLLHVITCSQ